MSHPFSRRALVAALLAAAPLAACARPVPVASAPSPAAAEPPPLVTDRPDFTESPLVVPAGAFQLELGDSYTTAGSASEHTVGELLLRVGLHPRVELRLAGNSFAVATADGFRTMGQQDAGIGVKLSLLPERAGRHVVPAAGLIVATSLPTGARAFRGDGPTPEAKLALGWSLAERWGLSSNLNVARPSVGGARIMEYVGSLSLAHEVGERVGAYAETYGGRTSRGERSAFGNVGLTFALADLLQLDARVGTGFGPSAGERFVGLGLARRW